MKRLKIIAALAAVLMATGCNSVSREEYDTCVSDYESQISDLKNQIEAQNSQISELNSQNSKLEESNQSLSSDINGYISQIDEYTSQIDELENGLPRKMNELLNAYEDGRYEKAVTLACIIHNNYNGTPEDEKAQQIMKKAQDEIDKAEAEEKAEAERKAAEAAKSEAEKVHEIIQVQELAVDRINFANGVDVRISWRNCSPKTIKYITFVVNPYNAVGDRVRCEITNSDSQWLQVTGPIEQSYVSKYYYWDAVWYNSTVKTLKFSSIEIEYTDGTKTKLSGDKLDYVIW